MANGNAGPNPALIIVALFVWFVACWVFPIVKLRDEKTTANMKTVYSGWLIIAGIIPVFYGIYLAYNARGNAASSNNGGNAPPAASVTPNLGTEMIGSETAVPQKVNGFPGGAAT
jgi:hypothetical protein